MTTDKEDVQATERERLRAFVEKDLAVLERVHANDFEMVNPAGVMLTKPQYIGGVAAGAIEYKSWQPDSDIAVQVYGDAAVAHYRSRQEIVVQGELQPQQRYWQTEVYEKRAGAWQLVWSQATRIAS